MRALVLADTSSQFRSVAMYLAELGFEITCPNSIEHARRALLARRYDLVVACVDSAFADALQLLSFAALHAPLLIVTAEALHQRMAALRIGVVVQAEAGHDTLAGAIKLALAERGSGPVN